MKISYIKIRVIVYDWDDPEGIKKKLYDLLEGIDKDEIKINETKGPGLISTNLLVYEVNLKKKKNILAFLKNLIKRINNFDNFYKNINFDENCSIYIRLDKDDLVNKDIANPIYSGNVFHIKISFDMPHKTKEKVLNEFKRIVEEIRKKI